MDCDGEAVSSLLRAHLCHRVQRRAELVLLLNATPNEFDVARCEHVLATLLAVAVWLRYACDAGSSFLPLMEILECSSY